MQARACLVFLGRTPTLPPVCSLTADTLFEMRLMESTSLLPLARQTSPSEDAFGIFWQGWYFRARILPRSCRAPLFPQPFIALLLPCSRSPSCHNQYLMLPPFVYRSCWAGVPFRRLICVSAEMAAVVRVTVVEVRVSRPILCVFHLSVHC